MLIHFILMMRNCHMTAQTASSSLDTECLLNQCYLSCLVLIVNYLFYFIHSLDFLFRFLYAKIGSIFQIIMFVSKCNVLFFLQKTIKFVKETPLFRGNKRN